MKHVLVLLALLAVASSAHAQFLDDPAGDVAIVAADQAQTVPGNRMAQIDLVAMDLKESEESLTMTVRLAQLGEQRDEAVGMIIDVPFTYGTRSYEARAWLVLTPSTQPNTLNARLEEIDESGTYARGSLEAQLDTAASTVTMTVPREWILDEDGTEPFPATALTSVYVRATGANLCGGCDVMGTQIPSVGWRDRMPDQGEAEFTFTMGLEQSGDALLKADRPSRASNGEATTFVFEILAMNTGEESTFQFSTTNVPSNWLVRTPDEVTLGSEPKRVPVIVQTPFAHQHGSAQRFIVEMTDVDDPQSVGRVELGVYYPEVPQPAGHHDTLTIHTLHWPEEAWEEALFTGLGTAIGQDISDIAYMNTLTEDPADENVAVGSYTCETSLLDKVAYCFTITLQPGLVMGLDFDLDRTGELDALVSTVAPLDGATLDGELIHFGPRDASQDPWERGPPTTLAMIQGADPVDVAANTQGSLHATITPTPDADLVPYQEGASLVLEMRVLSERIDNPIFGPSLAPELHGGSVTLPLIDYHDPVDASYFDKDIIHLTAAVQEKLVNPGASTVFEVDLHNAGADDAFTVSLIGSNVEWATLDPTELEVPADGTAKIRIAVAAPETAPHGEQADLVVRVQSQHDADASGLVRLLTTVDTEAIHAHEVLQEGSVAEAPLAVPVTLVALAVAVRRARP